MFLTRRTNGVIVAEDSDTTSVSYQGSWHISPVPSGTAHTTYIVGSTATFTFTGTSVAVYGTIAGSSPSPPNSTYILDDFFPAIFSPSAVPAQDLHDQLFYQSPMLLDGEHRLIVTYTGNNSCLLLDYFLHLHSPESPLALSLPPPPPSVAPIGLANRDLSNDLTLHTPGVVVADDSNSSYVFYQGGWMTGGQDVEYNHTTHGTKTAGSTATLYFSGTSVAVYGTVYGPGDAYAPVSTYTIDNTPPSTYNAPLANASLVQTQFYQSPTLQDGPHTLVVNYTSTNSEFWLDYFLFMPSPSSPSASNKKGLSTGVEAAVISVSALLAILLIGTATWCYMRRHKPSRRPKPLQKDESKPNPNPIELFSRARHVNINHATINAVSGNQDNASPRRRDDI